jgi:hypothetical protein
MEPEAAFPGIGGTPADGTVALVMDFDVHEAVECGCDAQRRTGGLIGVEDAVGHQLRDEQACVSAERAVRAAVELTRDERACERRRLGPADNRRLADLDQARLFI